MGIIPQEMAQLLPTLKPSEKELMARYYAHPTGPLFLQVAQLLQKRGFYNEALVVVEDGLNRYPNLFSARVFYAKELFNRGQIPLAYSVLKDHASTHPDNLMGQRLFLKIQLSLGHFSGAQKTLNLLKTVASDDAFTAFVRTLAAQGAWQEAKEKILQDLHEKGVEPQLNDEKIPSTLLPPTATAHMVSSHLTKKSASEENHWQSLSDGWEDSGPGLFKDIEAALSGVKPVSSKGLFSPLSAPSLKNSALEKRTLATLYLGQKDYVKACQVLASLVQENQGDEDLLNQYKHVKHMARRARAQQENELKRDEKKVTFLEKILNGLNDESF